MSAVELETPIIGPAFPSLGFIKASSSSSSLAVPRCSPAPFPAEASIAPTLLDLPFSLSQGISPPRQPLPQHHHQHLQSFLPSFASSSPHSQHQHQQQQQQQQQHQQLASPATALQTAQPHSQSRKRKRSSSDRGAYHDNDNNDDDDNSNDEDEDNDSDDKPPVAKQPFVRPEDIYQAQSFSTISFAPPFNFLSPLDMSQQRYGSYHNSPGNQGSQQPILPSQAAAAAAARRTSAPSSTSAGRGSSSSAGHLAGHSAGMYRSSGSEPPASYGTPQSSYYGSHMYDASGYGMGFGGSDYPSMSSNMTASPLSSVSQRAQLPQSSYQQEHQRYMPSMAYPPAQAHGGAYAPRPGHGQPVVGMSPEAQRQKPRCWEHGCNGREFSTFSNLLRHQREKSGTAAKSYCPRCGAEFTRSTAMANHLQQAKCKPRPGGE